MNEYYCKYCDMYIDYDELHDHLQLEPREKHKIRVGKGR